MDSGTVLMFVVIFFLAGALGEIYVDSHKDCAKTHNVYHCHLVAVPDEEVKK